MKLDRKLRMGMIGGGPGAFIGDVHRKASRLDGEIKLVAGAFESILKNPSRWAERFAGPGKGLWHLYRDDKIGIEAA